MNVELKELKELKKLQELNKLKIIEDNKNKIELEELKATKELSEYVNINLIKKTRIHKGLQGLKELKGLKGLKLVYRAHEFIKNNQLDLLKELSNQAKLEVFQAEVKKQKRNITVDIEEFKNIIQIIERLESIEEKKLKQDLSVQLLGIQKKVSEVDNEWLRWLHQRYSERFLNDNNRIWTVTSIFIPLSLAGLGYVKEGTLLTTSLLAIGSISLTFFWHLICEKHRFFQDEALDIVRIIENCIGINISIVKTKKGEKILNVKDEYKWTNWLKWNFHNQFRWTIFDLFRTTSIQNSRRYMRNTVTFVWILAVGLVFHRDIYKHNKYLQNYFMEIKLFLSKMITILINNVYELFC